MTSLSFVLVNLDWGAKTHTAWYGVFIAGFLNNFSTNIAGIPMIPDTILEESQGLAQAITMACINVAALTYTQLSYLPHEDTRGMFWLFAVVNFVAMFTVVPFIKDVIGSKEHISRGHSSMHETSKFKKVKEIYGQAFKVILTNKMVLISILGRAVANAVRKTAGNNISLAYEQNYDYLPSLE
jgi:hypothetical protein